MTTNPLLLTDGYKVSHREQYPEGTELVYSNFTARASRTGFPFVMNFGIQYFIKEFLIKRFNEGFFNRPKAEVVKEYYDEISAYLGNPDFDVTHIADLHDLGYLPIEIKAIEEGTLVPMKVPLLTIVNTEPRFFWLTNYLETLISNTLWGPITSATTAFCFRQLLNKAAMETVGNMEFVPWQGHDFSFRGTFGSDAGIASGAGHLLSFTGTDTIPAIKFLKDYYNAEGLIGGSVSATEHAVQCAGGCEEGEEYNTYLRLITKVYPKGIVSIVSDTWDYFGVLTNILPRLKEVIMNREGKVVIRPDSGDSIKIICGYSKNDFAELFLTENGEEHGVLNGNFVLRGEDNSEVKYLTYKGKYYVAKGNIYQTFQCTLAELQEIPEHEVKGTIQLLWELFGGTVSDKGYKMLDSHIGAILGDGVTLTVANEIITRLKEKGFASTNLVFGIGSYTYQYVTRDTYFMAMKATFCVINGVPKNIFKNPKTDTKQDKKSAKGLLCVEEKDGVLALRDEVTWEEEVKSLLTTVFKNGELTRETALAEIRARVDENLKKCLANE